MNENDDVKLSYDISYMKFSYTRKGVFLKYQFFRIIYWYIFVPILKLKETYQLLGHCKHMFDQESFQASRVNFGFVLFLPFHASILKPDFNLPLGETEGVCNLDSSPTGQVAVEVEFLL